MAYFHKIKRYSNGGKWCTTTNLEIDFDKESKDGWDVVSMQWEPGDWEYIVLFRQLSILPEDVPTKTLEVSESKEYNTIYDKHFNGRLQS